MADTKKKPSNPPLVKLGRLNNAGDIRRALRRLANAVIAGQLAPPVANSAMYAIAGISKAIELELQERVVRQLETQDAGGVAVSVSLAQSVNIPLPPEIAAWPLAAEQRQAIAAPVPESTPTAPATPSSSFEPARPATFEPPGEATEPQRADIRGWNER